MGTAYLCVRNLEKQVQDRGSQPNLRLAVCPLKAVVAPGMQVKVISSQPLSPFSGLNSMPRPEDGLRESHCFPKTPSPRRAGPMAGDFPSAALFRSLPAAEVTLEPAGLLCDAGLHINALSTKMAAKSSAVLATS